VLRRPSASRDAVQYLLRAGLRAGELGGLGLLTSEYQPYVAVYSLADMAEIDRQVQALINLLADKGMVAPKDIPAPEVPRDPPAWRETVLQHGEFLGLGRIVDGTLVCWSQR